MTVYYNPSRKRWMFDFVAQGLRHNAYCLDAEGLPVSSRAAAKQAEGVERRRVALAPKIPNARELTLGQVMDDLSEVWEKQASWANRRRYILELLTHFGAATPIASIDDGAIADYIRTAQASPTKVWRGGPSRDPSKPEHARYWSRSGKPRAPATINLYLDVLRACLKRAAQIRDPVTRRPALEHAPTVPELRVPRRKARPVPDDVLSALFALLPRHTADAMELTLYFGFRRGEVFSLEISNVDFDAGGVRLYAERVKDKEDTFLPGAPAAMKMLARLVEQAKERGTTHLITWRRHEEAEWISVKRSKSAWTRAMAIVEKKFGRRFRWHDIRAAFITHVALTSGAVAAQALARHSEYGTTAMYVEVADELRRKAATRAAKRPALKLVRK